MQGFIILATICTEKHTLVFYSTSRHKILTKSMEGEMVSQGYRVKVCACRACQRQLLYKFFIILAI